MNRLAALLCLPVLIGVAGAARADPEAPGPPDPKSAAFLDSLHAAGITYNRTDLVIATAEAVCKMVAGGKSGPEVVAALQSRNPALAPDRAGQFLAIAMRSYCPDQLAPATP